MFLLYAIVIKLFSHGFVIIFNKSLCVITELVYLMRCSTMRKFKKSVVVNYISTLFRFLEFWDLKFVFHNGHHEGTGTQEHSTL